MPLFSIEYNGIQLPSCQVSGQLWIRAIKLFMKILLITNRNKWTILKKVIKSIVSWTLFFKENNDEKKIVYFMVICFTITESDKKDP